MRSRKSAQTALAFAHTDGIDAIGFHHLLGHDRGVLAAEDDMGARRELPDRLRGFQASQKLHRHAADARDIVPAGGTRSVRTFRMDLEADVEDAYPMPFALGHSCQQRKADGNARHHVRVSGPRSDQENVEGSGSNSAPAASSY